MTLANLPSVLTWPPSYKIRKHKRAKHVRLRTSVQHGLEITVPLRFNLKDLPLILEENKLWIHQQLMQLPVKCENFLPSSIVFHSIPKTWHIDYSDCQSKLEMIMRPTGEIVLVGNVQDKALCKAKLLAWIKQYASTYLRSQLEAISNLTSLSFNRVIIRDQKTIWGSCTTKKSISLNYKLIFLPERLLRYVIIHELCHTKHLNHSKKFWDLVNSFDADWRLHRNELRVTNQYIPDWVG